MSFSGSISNALSGLRAATFAAEQVSSNLANATNENYATRNPELSSRVGAASGGVTVDSVTRSVDATLLDEWRRASTSTSELNVSVSYLSRAADLFGTPGTAGALPDLLAKFEAALVSAAARPDLSNRLEGVLTSAQDMVGALGRASSGVQSLRGEADAAIGRAVSDLNAHLSNIAELNTRIKRAEINGGNSLALQDLRQEAVDKVSDIVPVRVLPRDQGSVSLVSTSGAVLLEGTAAEIEFSPAGIVSEHKTSANGLLSGLSVNGQPVPIGSLSSWGKGGDLSALFELRDKTLVGYQSELDAFARDLVGRFQDNGLDPTILAGDPGLFADDGAAFDIANELGLARRLSVNSQVDPASSGELWRLRDGLYATAQGASGDGSLLLALGDRLRGDQTVASGNQVGFTSNPAKLLSALLSDIGANLTQSEDKLSYAAARSKELTEQKLRSGVDSDTELQKLLQIQNAYAANAKVLQTVDEMIDVLMGIS